MTKLFMVLSIIMLVVSCGTTKPRKPKEPADPVVAKPGTVLKKTHLNYKPDKDWSQCAKNDYVVFDMFETPKSDFQKCAEDGALMVCYFSSQFEDWRPDASEFTSSDKGKNLDDWPGEKWANPDSANVKRIMGKRLDLAKSMGCMAVDVDNMDFYHYKTGFDKSKTKAIEQAKFFAIEAHKRDLQFSLKNSMEMIPHLQAYVDMYQNEQCQQYNECDIYNGIGKPVFNIEYKSSKCKDTGYMYSVVKHVEKMHAWFEVCD